LKIQFFWDVTVYRWCIVLDIQGQAAWRWRSCNPSRRQALHSNNTAVAWFIYRSSQDFRLYNVRS